MNELRRYLYVEKSPKYSPAPTLVTSGPRIATVTNTTRMSAGNILSARAATKSCQVVAEAQLFQIKNPLIVKNMATPRTETSIPPHKGRRSVLPESMNPCPRITSHAAKSLRASKLFCR